MSPFVWVWLAQDWRRWAFQVRMLPPDACLVAPRPSSRNRVLALAHRLGRGDLRVLLQSEVNECLGLWRLKLALRGSVCVGGGPFDVPPHGSRGSLARLRGSGDLTDGGKRSEGFRVPPAPVVISAPRQEVARPGAISRVPVWARAAGARRRRVKALAAAGVVSL